MTQPPIKPVAVTLVAAFLCATEGAIGQDRAHSEIESPFAEFVDPRFPFFTQTLDARKMGGDVPENNLTPRGIILSPGNGVHACFDPDLLRVSLIWIENAEGEYLTMNGMAPGSYRVPGDKAPPGQDALPVPIGTPLFSTGIYPGWQAGETVSFTDPREPSPDPLEVGRGPLPESLGRFDGITTGEKTAFLACTAGSTRIQEEIRAARLGEHTVVLRFLRLGPHTDILSLVLGESAALTASCETGTVEAQDGRQVVLFPPADSEKDHLVILAPPGVQDAVRLISRIAKPAFPSPGEESAAETARRWPEPVTVRGVLAPGEDEPFVLDEIPLPYPNPWKRNVRLSGFDFFADGAAALCTFDGDVWIVRGLDESLAAVQWSRFASGLHEPIGLRVVDDQVYVFDRNGIWRLHDLDGNGEADFYEMFSGVVAQTAETREFALDLVEKPGGGFYVAKGGQIEATIGKYNGTVVEISPDGRKLNVVASGLRQPFIGVDPVTGMITSSDQQGNWVPSTPLHVIEQGRHYGFLPTILENPKHPGPITEPVCWIPHFVNQSGASQVWLRDADMGPLNESLLHIGYNRPEIFKVYLDESGPVRQGAIVRVLSGFPSATLKGEVHPGDGRLYVAGFKIWGTVAEQISGFLRVRFTGAPCYFPENIRSGENGILIRFHEKLDPQKAVERANYQVERWNYLRTENYGSGNYKLDGTPGVEPMAVSNVYLSEDGKAVFLGIPGMQPVMQMKLNYRFPFPEEENTSAPVAVAGASAGTDGAPPPPPLVLPRIESIYLTVHALNAIDLSREGFGDTEVDLTVPEPDPALAVAVAEPSVAEGEQLYAMMGCVACHSIDGSMEGKVGPSWKGLYGAEREFTDGTVVKSADDAYLRESIINPAGMVTKGFDGEGVGMPSYLGVLRDHQIESLVLYMKSLEGSPSKKKKDK